MIMRSIPCEPDKIDAALRRRLSPGEMAALTACLAGLVAFIILRPPALYNDYFNYINAARGDPSIYFYAPWLLPIFHIFNLLPELAGYFIWSLLNIAGVFFACRVFGGRAALAMTSYQMIYILFQGQITAILVGLLALFWWAAAHKKWALGGICLLIVAAKFQFGILLGGILWLYFPLSWRQRLQILIIPAAGALLSLLVWPGWPSDLIQRLQASPPNTGGSLALWRWIGPAALLFWLPPFLLPLDRTRRIVILSAAMSLGLPYLQQTDLLGLFVLPLGWLPLLGNLAYSAAWLGHAGQQILVLIPSGVYLWIVLRNLDHWAIFNRQPRPRLPD